MRFDLVAEGLLDRRRFQAWRSDTHQAIRAAVVRSMRGSGRDMAEQVRGEMRSSFGRATPRFLRSMQSKVFDRKADRFPALYLGSKVPWLGIHEAGGTIRGRMLVPLLPSDQRIGRKAFARLIESLMRSGNAWFISRNGQRILMASNAPGGSRSTSRFRRAQRERTGAKRLRRGEQFPIAVLVRRVTLRKRFDLKRAVRLQMPRLTSALRRALARV